MKCEKVRYASKKDADDDIERIRKKSNRSTTPIRSYQCTICDGRPWHLTSKIDYLAKIKELEDKLNLCKAHNSDLKRRLGDLSENAEENREARIRAKAEAKKEAIVIQLTNSNAKMQRELTMVRRNNSDLVAQVVQLNNKLEKLIQKDQAIQ